MKLGPTRRKLCRRETCEEHLPLRAQHTGDMGSLENYDYDLVTIGAGSGGTRASRISAQHYGAKVACVELPFGFLSSDEIGGAGGT